MSKAARTVIAFAVYLLLIGAVLVLVPNLLLSLFSIPETDEVWVRVVGMLAMITGFYYFTSARSGFTPMFRASVYARFSVLAFFVAFVVTGLAPPMLLIFGIIDAVAATWTALALRST